MADNLTQQNGVANSTEAPVTQQDSADKSADLGINVSQDVREVVGKLPHENKSSAAAQQQQKVATKSPQERKAELLARLPKDQQKAERFMRRQIEQSLENQLHALEKKLGDPDSYFDMNNIMAHIREFRDVLGQLVSMAYEQLKAVWLRFVHNLSV